MSSTLIAVVSDVHAGSTLSLAPEIVRLDDGGEYRASKAQLWLWQCWVDYWRRVREVQKEENAELRIIFNGDMVEGDHHRSTQILSANPNAQAAVVNECMKIPLGLKPSKLALVRGTETHVGNSACSEEKLADGWRRDKRPVVGDPETGAASWWHLRTEVGGVLIDVAHHGRTGQREHTRASQAVLHAHDILLSHVKSGDRPPDLCLRGHHHKFNDSGDACQVRVMTSGAWKLQDSHVHKIATDSISDIGGFIVVVKNRKYTVEKVHFKPSRGPVWRD